MNELEVNKVCVCKHQCNWYSLILLVKSSNSRGHRFENAVILFLELGGTEMILKSVFSILFF